MWSIPERKGDFNSSEGHPVAQKPGIFTQSVNEVRDQNSEVKSQKLTHPSPLPLPGGEVGDLSFAPKIFRQSRQGGATQLF
ncbi:hypothetical protein D5R40_10160 [Okeania hirsuta]|uniref:Uncharacterized protein n=1 Tax=Okeania hirsuta TaxID=1458930 RepID=A0A3N6PBG6_9CYAN|nr:hypothetical protein D4Z78_09110 [Okeania hirsuta]RQH45937.1 hypothetical protein D5R40_10160 [Okeania hirsuta]